MKRQRQRQLTLSSFQKDRGSTPKIRRLESRGAHRGVVSNGIGSKFGECPLCSISFPLHILQRHASNCTGIAENLMKDIEDRNVAKGWLQKSGKPSDPLVPKPMPLISTAKSSNAETNCNAQENECLHPTSEPLPGLYLYENFITEEEEEALLINIGADDCINPLRSSKFNGKHLGKRWGVHCNLRDRRVDADEHPLPKLVRDLLIAKLNKLPTMAGCVPNEANAIEYRRKLGHYLAAHVDDRKLSKESIANISLAGDCFMTFRNERQGNRATRVLLPRRCLQILTGSARYDCSHAISNKDLLTDRRVSITMRESPLTTQPPAPKPAGCSIADMLRKQSAS